MSTEGGPQAAAAARLPAEHAAWLRALASLARRPLALAMGLPLLAGLLLLVQAAALARALQRIVADGADLAQAWPPLALAAALVLVRAALLWWAERAGQQAAEAVKLAARRALFARLLEAGVLWSRARPSGELADALGTQAEALDGYFAGYLPALAGAAVLPLLFCAVLAGFDVVAALVLALTVPAIPLFMALVGWGAEAASRRHAAALARLSGLFADRVRGLLTLRLHGRAEAEQARVRAASEALRERTMAVLRIAFLSSAVLEFFAALGVAGVALYFGLSYLRLIDLRAAPLTLETGLFCLLMAPEVYLPLRRLAAHYHDRAAARGAVAQIASLYGTLPDPAPAAPAVDAGAPPAGPRRLEIAGLRVPMRAGATLRLEGPVAVAPGEWIALTGPSGSGKSTLLEALAGLREHDGRLELAGLAPRAWPQAALRRELLLIPQRPWLLPGSIADNLRLAAPQADPAALWQALRQAALDEVVRALPRGLDMPLGQRGQGLSGGQLQRLALARMYLADPRIVLLDEPTAHLDAATRDRVLAALARFAAGRTLVVATHDPAVVALASRLWEVLPDGRVVAA
ncbi:MAG: thiol reductant ABC exporter subunit CydD [Lysobacteraceae bacterium]|jgi:thiol reductant ABC exporter, CydD subunit|nr:thiol reductant ABC exporter subunit CydD [Xanthomonadaceae bacterium]